MTPTVQNPAPLVRRPEGAISHFTPWEEMNEVRRRMDDLFTRAFGYTPLNRFIPNFELEFEPSVDIYETDDSVVVFVAVPGFTPADVEIEATPDKLVISGARKVDFEIDKAVKHRAGRQENANKVYLSLNLPVEIDPKQIQANLKDGMLEVTMPKSEKARAKTVKVPIAGK